MKMNDYKHSIYPQHTILRGVCPGVVDEVHVLRVTGGHVGRRHHNQVPVLILSKADGDVCSSAHPLRFYYIDLIACDAIYLINYDILGINQSIH